MNPSKSPEQVLLSLLPILFVLVILIAGVVVLPTFTADPRSRASEPQKNVSVTPSADKPRPTFSPQSNTLKPQIICSDLYSPVCDTATNITYPSACEASLARVTKTTKGECKAKISLPSTN